MAKKCSLCGKQIGFFDIDYTYEKGGDEGRYICGDCSWKTHSNKENFVYEKIKENTSQSKTVNFVSKSKKHEKLSSINDCLKTDSITDNLWMWAERLETLGAILFWIIIVSGIVIAFSTSIITTEVVKGIYYQYTDTETTFSFSVFLTAVVQTALYAFIEYCAYHVLALLIGALANITQNTKATARLTEYVARKTLNEQETNPDKASTPEK